MENELVDFKTIDGTVLYCAWDATEPVVHTATVTGYPDRLTFDYIAKISYFAKYGIDMITVVTEIVNETLTVTMRKGTDEEIKSYRGITE
jgi:hypothetical protein